MLFWRHVMMSSRSAASHGGWCNIIVYSKYIPTSLNALRASVPTAKLGFVTIYLFIYLFWSHWFRNVECEWRTRREKKVQHVPLIRYRHTGVFAECELILSWERVEIRATPALTSAFFLILRSSDSSWDESRSLVVSLQLTARSSAFLQSSVSQMLVS